MKKALYIFFVLFISNIRANGQEQPPNPVSDTDKNWVSSIGYDILGNTLTKSVNYFNDNGKPIETQSWDVLTADVWTSKALYDQYSRLALTTLSAPQTSFGINSNFIRDPNGGFYTLLDYDLTDTNEEPNPVGLSSVLGAYYSASNADPFQDITVYPFTKNVYGTLNPERVLRVIGTNKMGGEWKQPYTFTMQASEELSQSVAFDDSAYDEYKVFKTIYRDVHGIESVVFTDIDGKTLASARSGDQENPGAPVRTMTIEIGEQNFVDVHVPSGTTGISISSIPSPYTAKVFNLITEQEVNSPLSSLPAGFYRIFIRHQDTNSDTIYTYDSSNPITVTYEENYYDYALNYYDDTGRLIKTTQPIGGDVESTYEYDSEEKIVSATSTDEGISNFKYRRDGQLRFSQNSKQLDASPVEVSYTNYDDLGRPVESGVLLNNSFAALDPDNTLPSGTRIEQHRTEYDSVDESELTALGIDVSYHTPTFLAGNVAKTINDQTTTYYSYDIYGRVKWLVQDIQGLGVKTIDYEYDPISSQVKKLYYQKHTPSELFVHRYMYNDAQSLIKVETSTDDGTFTEHAAYEYYRNRSLKNIQLAEGIQQIDYVYNLAGQLKAINHPDLTPEMDPGGNDDDMFGMVIDYHNDDYLRSDDFRKVDDVDTDLYNGNIEGITWNTDPNAGLGQAQYVYKYNRNNWLQEATFYSEGIVGDIQGSIIISTAQDANATIQAGQIITFSPGTSITPSNNSIFTAQIIETTSSFVEGDYLVSNITYDANGNIETLDRNKNTENGSNAMDQLDYTYDLTKPNQLDHVHDDIGDAGVQDIDSQTPGNYTYNTIGQLVSNVSDDVAYTYSSIGLVTEVRSLTTDISLTKFYYNDRDHRVKKETYNPSNGALQSVTHYVRDIKGTPLAIYEDNIVAEHAIYGTNRIGVHKRQSNTDLYQLTDHLGNVRAVIVKSGPNAAALTAKTDYYPFGMRMPYRNIEDNYRYGYQGEFAENEAVNETGATSSFELRLWDSRIGRWLSPDPYGEFYSPYLGMGNNPIVYADPDGGCTRCPKDANIGDHFTDPETGHIFTMTKNGWGTGMDGYAAALDEVVLGSDPEEELELESDEVPDIILEPTHAEKFQSDYDSLNWFQQLFVDYNTGMGNAQLADAQAADDQATIMMMQLQYNMEGISTVIAPGHKIDYGMPSTDFKLDISLKDGTNAALNLMTKKQTKAQHKKTRIKLAASRANRLKIKIKGKYIKLHMSKKTYRFYYKTKKGKKKYIKPNSKAQQLINQLLNQ